MKIVLIAPPLMDKIEDVLIPISMDAHRECPPYGIFLLASILRQAGYEVVIADLIALGTNRIDAYLPHITTCHLVGVGTSSLSWPTARDCINQVRKIRPEVPIVLGGIHATMFDKYVLATTPANFVIRGEGEIALPTLCRTLQKREDLRNVPNLTIKTPQGKIIRNPLGPKIKAQELKNYPIPDYSQLPIGTYNGLGIESSRGCPYDCSFCSTSYRQSWRAMEPEDFVNRVERILPHAYRTRSRTIQVIDDEFAIKTQRVITICKELERRHLKPTLVFDSRANDLLNEEYVETVAPYALQFLIGSECGYDEGLKKVGKGTTCAKLEGAASTLKKHGIADKADFSFILGLPWETKEDVTKTIRFACSLYATYGVRVLLQWYCQIPGSRLWDENRKNGIVHEALYDDFGFFQNLYLFRTGVKLTPQEICEISDMIVPIHAISKVHHPDRVMVEYAHPDPIRRFFPKLSSEYMEGIGLSSLREVSAT